MDKLFNEIMRMLTLNKRMINEQYKRETELAKKEFPKGTVKSYKDGSGYIIHGGPLDDTPFFLKPNRHGAYGINDYRKVTIHVDDPIVPDAILMVDECNPIDSFMIEPCRN